MPLLLYCISESEPAVPAPKVGVREHPVERCSVAGMICYYGELKQAPARFAREDALVFHKVITAIFSRTAVIPFRFPTIVEGLGELEVYLETEGHDLLESLQRTRDSVQMEVRLHHGEHEAAAGPGAAHLQDRQRTREILEQLADSARDFLGDSVQSWHIKEVPNGLRCYALVRRSEVATFKAKSQALKSEGEVRVAVSGPWPPTEFLHESPEA